MKPERQTRQKKIDLQLGRAGWAVGSRRLLEERLIETTTTLNEPAGDVAAIAAALQGPDLFVAEERLREAYHQPKAGLADFLRHILNVSKLPSREESISQAFDDWVRQHPQLTATQLMFVRTLRKAVMQKAEIATLDALKQPPFSAIGDPETLFPPEVLRDMLDLTRQLAAA